MWTIPSPERRRPVVLLVEDDPDVREMITQHLELRGFVVLTASNAVEALVACRTVQGGVDVLLTDLGLPGVSGSELARAVEADQPHVRVLYISGVPRDVAVRRRLIRSDARLLTKPFTADALAGTINGLLATTAHTRRGR